jgi:hypothetical protein
MRAERKHLIFIAIFCSFIFAPGLMCIHASSDASTVEITGQVPLGAYNVVAIDITHTAANISWMTNCLTNSTVQYGLTTGYDQSANSSEMVFSHNIPLEGLSGGTMYHYRVVSYDSTGANCTSPDYSFITSASKSVIGSSGGGGSISSIGNIVGLPSVDLPMSAPELTIVSGDPIPMTADNLVAEPVVVVSGDKSASLSIDANTLLLDRDGQPVSSIDLTRIDSNEVPAVPKGSMFIFSGYAYQIEPTGATFSPPVALKITTTPGEWKQLAGQELSIQYYNPVSGLWEALSTTTDPATNSVTTIISHSSDYGLFVRPASPVSPITTLPARTTVSPQGAMQGDLRGFDWIIVVQGLAFIMTIVVAASIGLLLCRKKNGR